METQISENFKAACSHGIPALLETGITVLQQTKKSLILKDSQSKFQPKSIRYAWIGFP